VVLTLRGRGLPHRGASGRGDQHVRIHVWTPTELSPEAQDLFRRLAELEGPAPARAGNGQKGFWERVKDAFAA
jgi:molecular chaperone DnaJ